MIHLLAFSTLLLAHWASCADDQVQRFIDDFNNIATYEGLNCSRIEGSAPECLACYDCNHDRIKRAKEILHRLTFSYSNCNKNQLCCIKSNELRARSNDDGCGKQNPDGNPPRRRPSVRSVMERQYPWRAWIYSAKQKEPLCAASYIFFGANALLTTASCVSGYQPSDLLVKFTKTENAYKVSRIVPHESFTVSKGGNINDIAVVSLTSKPNNLVRSVCLENHPALPGSSCVVVSDSETHINTIVPQLSKCKSNNVTTENNVMCTFMVKGDYIPQPGAGLYCLSEHFITPSYALYGIYQSYDDSGPVALFTAVHNYSNWILKTTNDMRKHH